ncbi:hypothetical protein VHEMI05244 [[Torrubiella] hemipterigena]|uniref:J domain-containing protein n=1 Tax=[Torrubiella] hemipterigena TaxID=1531966 RepID=A0A0A1TG53_9HYPO|nr:hypothetical protein VHEMI05244 [[Torrubiella] hemipterigena]
MSDDNKDLVRYAAEYADKQIDLYEMLGVDALTAKEDIHRAWRKRSLKYHPDKAGDKFDAEVWERFEHARDILSDSNARTIYDQSMKAKLLRKQERQAMDEERQQFANDLEARENAARQQQARKEQEDREMMQKERERLAEMQRMRDEETKRQAEAAQEMDDMAEARRRIQQRKEEKARKKQAKEAMKGASYISKSKGPANGAVTVPGDFLVTVGEKQQKYWELVCDKLRAVQTMRDLQQNQAAAQDLEMAEKSVEEARRRIHDAEMSYQQRAAA